MEWGWLTQLKDIDPKQIGPLLGISVAIYLLFAKRIKAIEERMVRVEASAATVQRISERLDDLFDLVKEGLKISRSPSVLPASRTDEMRLHDLARAESERWRDR